MNVNAYPGGESPFYGAEELILICDECSREWSPEKDYDLYPDEGAMTLQLADSDAECPLCGSKDSDWRLES